VSENHRPGDFLLWARVSPEGINILALSLLILISFIWPRDFYGERSPRDGATAGRKINGEMRFYALEAPREEITLHKQRRAANVCPACA
jgi:hypothetical protein